MTCSDFLQGFSEYYDGTVAESDRLEAEDHLADCSECRRYLQVVDRGRKLLRSFPEVEVSDDFRPRLQHRIYHLEDGEVLRRGMWGSASGTTAITAFGMAVLMVVAAWSPSLLSFRPEVVLSPIVVSRPEARPVGLRLRPYRLLPGGGGETPLNGRDLWRQPNSLLFRNSPLFDRARSSLRRTELE